MAKTGKTGILDYGAGNIRSVFRAVDHVGGEPIILHDPEQIADCDRIILPGVGAAHHAMQALREKQFDRALTEFVMQRGRPFLGICLGMQLIAEELTEHGRSRGLGWIPGRVVSLREVVEGAVRVPHMGWNRVAIAAKGTNGANGSGGSGVWRVFRKAPHFYFAHSYTLRCPERYVVNTVDYGVDLVAAVEHGNVLACQYHPEKSQTSGEAFLAAFLDWSP